MKLSFAAALTLAFLSASFVNVIKAQICIPDPPTFSDTIAMKVEKVESVPTQATDAWCLVLQHGCHG
jgi:hypothetical protein